MSIPAFLLCVLLPLTLALEEFEPAYISSASLNPASLHQAPPPASASRLSLLQYIMAAKAQNQREAAAEAAAGLFNNNNNNNAAGSVADAANEEEGGLRVATNNNKRFSDFAMPYIKYKRNNGIWIWMPAQGYVSVPKDQQALNSEEAAKQGKIMRYGK